MQVAWQGSGQRHVSLVVDVSPDGIFIETAEPPGVQTELELVFKAPGREIRARGRVRRSVPGKGPGKGMDVEVVSMGTEDQARRRELQKSPGKMETEYDQKNPSTPVHDAAQPELAEKAVADLSARTGGAERRSHVRYSAEAMVEMIEIESGQEMTSRLVNLSRKGCAVETTIPVRMGAQLSLRIANKDESFEAQARVVYMNPPQDMGLHFTALQPQGLRILERWLDASMGTTSWFKGNRRKSQRLAMAVAVKVEGRDRAGAVFTEKTHTVYISPHGASLFLSNVVNKGQHLLLSNPRTGGTVECVVIYVPQTSTNAREVGVSFMSSNPRFWKIAFPPSDWSPQHPDAKQG